MGLIDKDATLKAIADYLRADLADCNHHYLQGAQDVAEVVENMPERGGWIPCSERLPDTHSVDEIGLFGEKCGEFRLSDPVLGYVSGLGDDVSMAVVWYEDDMDGTTGWTTAPDCMNVNVIAWQPLPEPYKEADNGQSRTPEGGET